MNLPSDFAALARVPLAYFHLLAFAVAAAGIALGDLALMARPLRDNARLLLSMRLVRTGLLGLAVSGLALVGLDTGFNLEQIAARPKLLAKLTVVGCLAANGFVLHRWAFPALLADPGAPLSRGVVALGAVSLTSWLFAAFLGVAGPLSGLLGYAGFIALYLGALMVAVPVARLVMGPHARSGRTSAAAASPEAVLTS